MGYEGHRILRVLHVTNRADCEIVHVATRCVAPERTPVADFRDFGEMVLRNNVATSYASMHWFTPDGLADWGDGRIFYVGTEGSIELRKNQDLLGRPGGAHLFLTDRNETRYISCAERPIAGFRAFANDVRDRTETSMPQALCFTVCRLALEAEEKAVIDS